jgi:hypothetical protein
VSRSDQDLRTLPELTHSTGASESLLDAQHACDKPLNSHGHLPRRRTRTFAHEHQPDRCRDGPAPFGTAPRCRDANDPHAVAPYGFDRTPTRSVGDGRFSQFAWPAFAIRRTLPMWRSPRQRCNPLPAAAALRDPPSSDVTNAWSESIGRPGLVAAARRASVAATTRNRSKTVAATRLRRFFSASWRCVRTWCTVIALTPSRSTNDAKISGPFRRPAALSLAAAPACVVQQLTPQR